jgi:6-phosphogluconate dehydrogenase
LVGLGKMGFPVARRLTDNGWQVVAFDADEETRQRASRQGISVTASPRELCDALCGRRLIWMMVPAGPTVDAVLFGEPGNGDGDGEGLVDVLGQGDIVIDAGNSFYRDSLRRAAILAANGLHFLDCGTSGGVEGAEHGLCLMVGGPQVAVETAAPMLRLLAGPEGFLHVGPQGAGHFVKMVHNAIEYGMLEAIGEGFELLTAAPFPELDLERIAHLWKRGSVIRGWLMELAERAFSKEPRLEAISGSIGGGSTGSWAIEEAWKAGVPLPAIAVSYAMRHRSRQEDSFAGKVVAALRHEFGGHDTVPTR